MKKTLYLMRHGETLFNQQKKIQGWCDSPLTPNGQQQALIAKQYFDENEIVFKEAYSSTSERACDRLILVIQNKIIFLSMHTALSIVFVYFICQAVEWIKSYLGYRLIRSDAWMKNVTQTI